MKFNTISEVRKEFDAVQAEIIQQGRLHYVDKTDTYYAKKGDDGGRVLCKKYKALSRVLNALYDLEELYNA